jgi:hemerythrin superfamily protein
MPSATEGSVPDTWHDGARIVKPKATAKETKLMVATARKSSRRASKSRTDDETDAIEILTEDHRKVDDLFEEYESSKDDADDDVKSELVAAICLALTIHSTVEEEVFYPAARDALDEEDADMIDEAEVEHSSIKYLIADLSDMTPSDDLYDAKVKVLSEYVKHHVQEEEGEIFPALRDTDLDLDALGARLAARKEALREEYEENMEQ